MRTGLVQLEGLTLEVSDGLNINQGDTYIAKRNTGWKLLTCKEHKRREGYIVPEENEYAYDTFECFKVLSIVD